MRVARATLPSPSPSPRARERELTFAVKTHFRFKEISSSDSGFTPLRLDQDFDQLVEGGVGALVDLFHLHRADGMLHDQHRMVGRAEGFFLGFRQGIEGVSDDGHGEPAAFL